MKSVAIFGATGQTGEYCLKTALEQKCSVKVLARTPDKIKQKDGNCSIIQGNVLDYDAVKRTVDGAECVVVVLGTSNYAQETTELSDGLANILKAMQEAKVDKMSVCMSAYHFFDLEKVPKALKHLHDDHERMYQLLLKSNVKYVAVFPPHISSEPSREIVTCEGKNPGRAISKEDLGRFMVNCLDDPSNFGKCIGLANKPLVV